MITFLYFLYWGQMKAVDLKTYFVRNIFPEKSCQPRVFVFLCVQYSILRGISERIAKYAFAHLITCVLTNFSLALSKAFFMTNQALSKSKLASKS